MCNFGIISIQEYAGLRCQVTGWGKDAFLNGDYQQVLKEVDVPVVTNGQCEAMLKRTRLGADFVLHPGFMCAGGEEGMTCTLISSTQCNKNLRFS